MDDTRRDFLKKTTAGLASLALARGAGTERPATGRSASGLAAPKLGQVRWGFIGVGARGSSHLKEMVHIPDCAVTALCDIDPEALRGGAGMVTGAGQAGPATCGDSPEAYRRLLERADVDAVMICTPWRWHVPMAVAALRAGKHAFIEVPAAITIEGCWELVETAEETGRHCMMLENCCYGEDEMMLLNLCRQEILGELVHGEGSYLHDLRWQLDDITKSEGRWRPAEHVSRNGNIYPTHGLGIIAQCMNINRGDRFSSLVSMSSQPLGFADHLASLPASHPMRATRFACGDMNTSIVRTARGRTILVQHDTSNFRPYSRGTMLQGTHGIFAGYPSRIAVEGRGKGDEWDLDLKPWQERYGHPLWKRHRAMQAGLGQLGKGHGGMDYVMKLRIVQCLREGRPLDMDVYDLAAWCAVGPLSEESVARGGAPAPFPDFTRGGWKTAAPLGIVS